MAVRLHRPEPGLYRFSLQKEEGGGTCLLDSVRLKPSDTDALQLEESETDNIPRPSWQRKSRITRGLSAKQGTNEPVRSMNGLHSGRSAPRPGGLSSPGGQGTTI